MASSRPSAAGLSLTESSLLSLLAQASDLRTYQVHSDAIIELHALVIGKERSSEAKPATGSPPPSLLEPLAAACSTGLKHLHKLLRFLPEVSFDLPQSAGSAAYTPLPAAVGSGVSSDELELIADVSRPLQCLCGCLAAEVGRFCSDSRISQKLPELVATSGEHALHGMLHGWWWCLQEVLCLVAFATFPKNPVWLHLPKYEWPWHAEVHVCWEMAAVTQHSRA